MRGNRREIYGKGYTYVITRRIVQRKDESAVRVRVKAYKGFGTSGEVAKDEFKDYTVYASGDAAFERIVNQVQSWSIRTTKGEGTTMAAKTTTETTPAMSEEFLALIDRIRVKRLAGEDAEELIAEAKSAKDAWKGADRVETNKGRKAMLAEINAAAETKPTAPATAPLDGTVVTAADRAADTPSWRDLEDGKDLLDLAAGKFVSGTKLHLKTGDTAGEIADIVLDVRKRLMFRGEPDMMAKGGAARAFIKDLVDESARVYIAQNPDADIDEVSLAADQMHTAIKNALRNKLVYWARALDANHEDAERFAFALEGKPEGTTLSEAVRAKYGIAEQSPAEKMKEKARKDRELREAAKARGELTTGAKGGADADGESGDGEGSGESTGTTTPPKEIAQIDKIEKAGDVIEKESEPAKLPAKELDELEAIKSQIEAEAARLIRLAGRYAAEIKRRKEEENV